MVIKIGMEKERNANQEPILAQYNKMQTNYDAAVKNMGDFDARYTAVNRKLNSWKPYVGAVALSAAAFVGSFAFKSPAVRTHIRYGAGAVALCAITAKYSMERTKELLQEEATARSSYDLWERMRDTHSKDLIDLSSRINRLDPSLLSTPKADAPRETANGQPINPISRLS